MLDYFSALQIEKKESKNSKLFWLWLSISINLIFLGIFKYYNFFIKSFADFLLHLGIHTNPWILNIVLPVGISFYTFHGLSYIIDVYKKKIKPEENFVDYALFVSFFALLVAGPIERATHLLAQIKKKREFSYERILDGLRQILWGLFKKMVVADNCAFYANKIFANYEQYNGTTLALGAFLFAIQIYGDFSGYSDIALGSAKLLGFELLKNFSFPYFSRDIAEFWRRWHISLSSWFRDYIYIPLGGSSGGNWTRIRNTFIIFIISGFWHGANWTFIVWGIINALYILPSIILRTNRNNLNIIAKGNLFPNFKELFQMSLTFFLTTIAWIFFRSDSVKDACNYIIRMFATAFKGIGYPYKLLDANPSIIFFIIILFIAEWDMKEYDHALQFQYKKISKLQKWAVYTFLTLSILWFLGEQEQFIYFQF